LIHLDLLEGSRARRLFDRLEEDFQRYLVQLPPGLDWLAWERGTYHGDNNPQRFDGLAGLNPVLVSTPWLFWELFLVLEDEPFVQLSEAGAFFVLASVVLDHLVDGQTNTPGLLSLYHQALYSQGMAIYRQAIPPASSFWEHFDRLATEHLTGLTTEVAVQSRPGDYSFETLKIVAHGKVAPIVTALAGMCAVSGQMAIFAPIEASLKHISIASQLLDDIGDWQVDVQNRHLTYFLALLKPPEAWTRAEWPDIEKLQQSLDGGWIDVTQLKRVMQGLNQAMEAVQGLNCPAWVRYVDGYRSITDGHLERCIKRHLGQVFYGF
jgi:hypothetical protein